MVSTIPSVTTFGSGAGPMAFKSSKAVASGGSDSGREPQAAQKAAQSEIAWIRRFNELLLPFMGPAVCGSHSARVRHLRENSIDRATHSSPALTRLVPRRPRCSTETTLQKARDDGGAHLPPRHAPR